MSGPQTAITAARCEPCPNPWCDSHTFGEAGAPDADADIWALSGAFAPRYAVRCHYCPMQGPAADDELKAIEAWNARAQTKADAARIAELEEGLERLRKLETLCKELVVAFRESLNERNNSPLTDPAARLADASMALIMTRVCNLFESAVGADVLAFPTPAALETTHDPCRRD